VVAEQPAVRQRVVTPLSRRRATVKSPASPPQERCVDEVEFERIPCVVNIATLVWGSSPRSEGEDPQHIERLVEAEWPLPPILVHRHTMRIIDGHHRVRAAKRKNLHTIDAYFVGGSKESAFVLAVQENSVHGLPLALPDRRTAAARILQAYPNWSDRRIAAATGLSARTVASVRCASAETPQSRTRLGKDGRVRPLKAAGGRERAAELIYLRPEASLREIAQATGISPSTVRDVRARLDRGESPVPAADGSEQKQPFAAQDISAAGGRVRPMPVPPARQAPVDLTATGPLLKTLARDPALRMNAAGRELLRWLHHHAVSNEDGRLIADDIPVHCLEHLAELARRCSANWAAIADDLARRSNDTRVPVHAVASLVTDQDAQPS
jgi:ParB-like chromosome segregation protein Spo0J